MTKKLTINDLGVMIAKGFASADEKMGAMESRLSGKIAEVGAKLSAQGTSWRTDFDDLEGRVAQTETDVMALNKIVFKKRDT